jgi:hypothetical protein
LIIGERERAENSVTLRDMREFAEVLVPTTDVIEAVKARLGR